MRMRARTHTCARAHTHMRACAYTHVPKEPVASKPNKKMKVWGHPEATATRGSLSPWNV